MTGRKSEASVRSKACTGCRKRKLKCDGTKPICGPCIKANTVEDCQYVGIRGVSHADKLEEQISILEQRLQQLENPRYQGESVFLHNPYTVIGANSHPSGLGPKADQANQPSGLVREELIGAVLENTWQTGFFLHIPTFIEVVRHDSPGSRCKKDSWRYLLSAIYVCGTLVLPDKYGSFEEVALRQALTRRVDAMRENDATEQNVILQAEILLSRYYTYVGKFVDASYHSSLSISLGCMLKFHCLQPLQEQASPVEIGERIEAFWTFYENDIMMSIIQGSKKSITDSIQLAEMSVPWPKGSPSRYSHLVSPEQQPVIQAWLDNPRSTLEHDGPAALNKRGSVISSKVLDLFLETGRKGYMPFYASSPAIPDHRSPNRMASAGIAQEDSSLLDPPVSARPSPKSPYELFHMFLRMSEAVLTRSRVFRRKELPAHERTWCIVAEMQTNVVRLRLCEFYYYSRATSQPRSSEKFWSIDPGQVLNIQHSSLAALFNLTTELPTNLQILPPHLTGIWTYAMAYLSGREGVRQRLELLTPDLRKSIKAGLEAMERFRKRSPLALRRNIEHIRETWSKLCRA